MAREFNLEKQMLASAKSRAKKKNIPFNLELSDIKIPTICPLLGIELKRNKNGECRDSSPSLDRKTPSLGYVKGNIWVISQKANMMKNNGTIGDFSKISKALSYSKDKTIRARIWGDLLAEYKIDKEDSGIKDESEYIRSVFKKYLAEQKQKRQQFELDGI